MLLSATLSKPVNDIEKILGKEYIKIKISIENSADGTGYFLEMFTKTKVFHQHMNENEINDFLEKNAGHTFKNCVKKTETEEITLLTNKKGKITELKKKLPQPETQLSHIKYVNQPQKKKNYLLPEGRPVPFLILLGIMTSEGKIVSSKYDKFRQINRFLEFINDTLPYIYKEGQTLTIADFGCGKSYLTFAVHYFLTQIKKIDCKIEGLDLKQDVIDYCNDMVKKLNLDGLVFKTGNISDYSSDEAPDLIITLHACDTATDYALQYAVSKNAKAILSVPCCQHQINSQLKDVNPEFSSLLKWGLIKEKFASLVTDALRGEWLENQGYKVQMLEFIDEEHTPKNLLIRAVKKENQDKKNPGQKPALLNALAINPEIWK